MNEASPPELHDGSATEAKGIPGPARGPAKAVQILLPVWGYRFIQQFLEFCLPTLLAPGNVPALAKALPCKFVLLTQIEDAPLLTEHPAWQRLAAVCETEIRSIDDLVTDGNHTATITLAFARCVRETGDSMLDTLFFFLNSDFLVAKGSLANVLARLQAGASGVLAGNFQIIAQEASSVIRLRSDPSSPALSIAPRDLVTWSLNRLHPATAANIVNFKLSHNSHSNRLFWRVDESTLLGRFYLMHVIALRPEITDFVIGSSYDYSFIPEMCPSNNVTAMTDSDEYLVVELQPRDHESKFLRLGPIAAEKLAVSLSEWTTARHRENANNVLVYHGREIPPAFADVARQADDFIEKVNRNLRPAPQPHRHHPYWIGSMVAHRTARGQALSRHDWKFIVGEVPSPAGLTALLWKARFWLFGQPPEVTPWHPRWPDYQLPLEALRNPPAERNRVLVISRNPATYAHWLTTSTCDVFSLEYEKILQMHQSQYMPMIGNFDTCLAFFSEGDLERGREFVERVGPLLKPSGRIYVMVQNFRVVDAVGFGSGCAYHSNRLLNLNVWLENIRYVSSSRFRTRVNEAIRSLLEGVRQKPAIYLPLAALAMGPLAIASYVANRGALRTTSEPPEDRICSSVFIELRPSNVPLPRFTKDPKFARLKKIIGRTAAPVVSDSRPSAEARGQNMGQIFGLSSSQIWDEDPRLLTRALARYRFVAKLLADQHDVAEVGCGDAFGTRIVLQEVKKVTVYDPDPVLIEDVNRRYQDTWPLDIYIHNILIEPLPKLHDAIFSLETFQNVSPGDEDKLLENLRVSLRRDQSILIVGTPRTPIATHQFSESDPPAYGRSGIALKRMMERHFEVVLIFSMFDDVVLAGNSPTADYLFALCCARRP